MSLPTGRFFGTEMPPMKKLMILFTLALAVAGVRAALPQPDLLAQIHFAGAQKILAAPNVGAFTNEFCSVEALALRAQTVKKLAPWLAGWLQQKAGATPGGAERLRPLLDDLVTAEWRLEARVGADGRPLVALAVKLEAGRATLWQENLKAVLPAAGLKASSGWLYVSYGAGAAVLADGLAGKIGRPDAAWLAADVNWPRLAQWYPRLKELGLPETRFTVTAPDDNFRINGSCLFPENVAVNLSAWQLPTNALHQPFISLTAVRGLSGWLAHQPWAQAYLPAPLPDQFFAWALPQMPFQTFYAVPVADSAGTLPQLAAKLQPLFNSSSGTGALSPINLALQGNEMTFSGAPFFAPFIRAIQEPAGQFLFGGYFPNTPRSKPLPPELFARLADTNLLFYHWEITAERLGPKMDQLTQLAQLGLMLTGHRQLGGESAAFQWLKRIAPTLGNTITEVKLAGPAEFSFSRKAPGMLTAVEFFALASWLEAPNFPGCDLKLPPRPARFKLTQPKPPAAVPAVPGH